MILACCFCNKDQPGSQMKRCSRCLLITYCSKECQTLSWKASHKLYCKVHPSIDPSKPKGPKPEKFSPEWAGLEVDRQFSRWIYLWRFSFQTWATISLDLGNHPRERVMTHCMHLIIEPVNLEDDPAKPYRVVHASVEPIALLREIYPALELTIEPTNFTRLRFLVILKNFKGEPRRLRLVQWSDPNVEKWREISKESSREIMDGWESALMWSVENTNPSDVEEKPGKRQSRMGDSRSGTLR